jgi:HlyD family secretion protein
MKRVVFPGVVAASLLGLVSCGGEPDYAVGTIERHRIEVVADSNEPLEALFVSEGDRVSPGDLLARQVTVRIDQALEQARADASVALAHLEEAETGPRAQEIEVARARLAAAESAYSTLSLELHREEALLAEDFAPQNTVDVLRGRFEEAAARRDEAEAALDELLEGTRSERVAQARSNYAARRAELGRLEIDRERASLRAPVTGVVESIVFRPGERPQPGQTVIALLSDERIFARVHVPEPLLTRISVGSVAWLRIDGHAEEYEGRVRWISSEAAFTPYYALTQKDRSRLAYLAEVDLTDDIELPSGIPVEVRFPGDGNHE